MSGTASSADLTAPVPVTDNGGSLTVDGAVDVGNFPATQPISAAALPLPAGAATLAAQVDSEFFQMCDTVTTFLRRYSVSPLGVVSFVDTTFNGVTPYVPVGAVTRCTAISGSVTVATGPNVGSIIVTRVFNAFPVATAQRITSVLARRVQILWENSSASPALRPTVNGVPMFQQSSQGGANIVIGDLNTSGTLPAFTIRTNLATDDLTVIEEL